MGFMLQKLVGPKNACSKGCVFIAVMIRYKCTKHQFIHLLTATFKDLHIETVSYTHLTLPTNREV